MLYRKGSTLFGEIHNQPAVWKDVLEVMTQQRESLSAWFKTQNFGQVIYVSTGDLLNVATSASRITHLVSGLNSVAMSFSEILYGRRAPYDVRIRTLIMVLSKPGMACELTWAIEKLKAVDPKAQYLILEAGESELNGLASVDIAFPNLKDACKVPVATPSGLLLASLATVSLISGKQVLWDELARLPEILESNLKAWQSRAQQIFLNKPTNIVFLGSGPFIGVAQQAALSMQKMAAMPCSAHSCIEYTQGAYASLNNLMMVVVLMSNTFKASEERIIGDLAVTRAIRVAVADQDSTQLARCCDELFEMKSGVSEIARVLLMMPVTQMLAFYMAMAKGVNPDNPKHLDHAPLVLKERPGVKAGA